MFYIKLYVLIFTVTRALARALDRCCGLKLTRIFYREPKPILKRRRTIQEPPQSIQIETPQPRQKRSQTLDAIIWCYCSRPDDGSKMVRCDYLRCKTKWFHVRYLDEVVDLDGPWKCRACRP